MTQAERAQIQARTVVTLVGAQVLGGLGMASGIAVGALLAEDLSGNESLAGLGTTFQVLGSAFIAIPAARTMARRGRAIGLQFCLALALAGTAMIILAASIRSFPLLLVGMMLFGGGTTANNQSRYAAADLADPARRGRDLSMVVWATTIGSVLGPNLVGPGRDLARSVHLPPLAGVFLFSLVGFVLAILVIRFRLRPDPLLTARALARSPAGGAVADPVEDHDGSVGRGLRVLAARPEAAVGAAVMALGHLVMVGVMVMTPIHMKHGHAELEVIGFVISVHIAGMFALSPLVGMAVDRWGSFVVAAVGGAILLAASVLAASTHPGSSTRLLVALFLLGLGWSCAFVAGSTKLSAVVTAAERPAVQGVADLMTGLAGAAGGVLAGVVVDQYGYDHLAVIAAGISALVIAAALIAGPLRPTQRPNGRPAQRTP